MSFAIELVLNVNEDCTVSMIKMRRKTVEQSTTSSNFICFVNAGMGQVMGASLVSEIKIKIEI